MEESTDIYNLIAKANSSPDKAAAYAKLFAEDFPKHMGFLEALLPGAVFNLV